MGVLIEILKRRLSLQILGLKYVVFVSKCSSEYNPNGNWDKTKVTTLINDPNFHYLSTDVRPFNRIRCIDYAPMSRYTFFPVNDKYAKRAIPKPRVHLSCS